jgi:hypothetical protein
VTLLRRQARVVAATTVSGLLLWGCSGDGDGQAAPDPAVTDSDEVDGDDPGGTADPEGEGAADPDAEPGETSDIGTSDGAEPVVVDLDLEERTANGTVFRVHRLEVTDLSILVDVEIIGSANFATMWFNNQMSTPAVIEDDLGNEYPLIPPEGNRSLNVKGGEQLEGTLSYQGPLHADVTTVTLRFNDDSDPDSTNQNDQMYPYFRFGPIALGD